MKIIIVDNYDSFTYNIAHYVEQFTTVCQVVKVDCINVSDLENYDKIILSPGPGLPKERPALNKIIKAFYKTKPILGICLGHQALAEFFGAELFNMDKVHHGIARETVLLEPDYLWCKLPTLINTGRYHSWAMSSFDIPEELIVSAIDSEDETIMAFLHRDYDVRGIQFHPESILTEYGLKMIKNWVLH